MVAASRITLIRSESVGGRRREWQQNVTAKGDVNNDLSAMNRCHVPPNLIESY
jgi:hypothetical protein